jgi:hypothetical protein
MKKTLLSFGLALLITAAANAVPSDVTYAEGDVTTRLSSGKQQDTSIGDVLNTGDSVKTGQDGQAELDQKGVTIKVSHGTVFTLMERSQAGQTSSVMSVALGSIRFRYDKLTGQEPMVRTNGAVAGVRGTEFSVFAGADGSTLIAVDSGQVTVQAEGKSVELASAEGVEVPLGQPPGDKFVVHSDQIDYSKWNGDKLSAMLADPIAALQSVQTALTGYIKDANDYSSMLKDYREKLLAEQQKLAAIRNEKGKAEGDKYASEIVSPLLTQTINLGLNMRFSALAALSLRRFVGGRLYLFMKERYIANVEDPTYTDFLAQYDSLLSSFEQSIVPFLVQADI